MGVKSTGAESLECCGRGDNNNSNHPTIDSDHTQRINDRARSAPPNPPPYPMPQQQQPLPPPMHQLPLPRQFEQYHHIMSRQDLQNNNNVYENYIDNHLFMNPMHDNYQYPYFLTNTPVDEWSTTTISINNNNINNNNYSSYPTTPRSSTATFVDIPDSTLTIGTDMSLKLTPVSLTPKLSPLAMKVVEQIKAKASPKKDKDKEKEKEKKKDKGISQAARIRAAGRQAGGRGGTDDPLAGRTRRTNSKKETKKEKEERELIEKLLREQLQQQELEILK